MEILKTKRTNRLFGNNKSSDKSDKRGLSSLEEMISVSRIPETSRIQKTVKTSTNISMPEYLGFHKHPFGDSLDTSFFYKSDTHEATILKMKMSIEHDISFGLVYGTSGTGKTLISQSILEQLPRKKFLPVLVPVTPNLSKSGFLKIILKGLDIECDNIRSLNTLVDMLADKILSLYNNNRKPVLLIDEAHFLSSGALHILRTLSNFEAFNKKLITCILFAEKHFTRRLKNPSYASLKSRIYLDVELNPLNKKECANYIKYRLMMAGNDKADFFSQDQINTIYEKSQGIPRNINKQCTILMVDKYVERR